MRILLTGFFSSLLLLSACASNPQHGRYEQEKNAPKFGNTRAFTESPAEVRRAARAALDQLDRESDPPVVNTIYGDDDQMNTGWVYETSRSKYVEYQENGVPARKPLRIRRKYIYAVAPALSGSQVTLGADEEVMQLDLKTGQETGWKSSETDPAAYEKMTRVLRERLREQKN